MVDFLYDSFTPTASQSLSARVPNIGGTWVRTLAGNDFTVATAGYVQQTGTAPTLYYNTAAPPSPDYTVNVGMWANGTGPQMGLVVRYDTATGNHYRLRTFGNTATSGVLEKVIGGTATTIATFPGRTASSTTDYWSLTVKGSNFIIGRNGNVHATATDGDITAAGVVGLYAGGSSSTSRFYPISAAGESGPVPATESLHNRDTFTQATAGALSAHTSDTGNSWSNLITSPAIQVGNGYAATTAAGTAFCRANPVLPVADYTVTADLTAGGTDVRLCARVNSQTQYYAIQVASTVTQLIKQAGSTLTVLAPLTTQAVGETVTWALKLEGTTIKAYRNGVLDGTASDSTYTAANYAGLGIQGVNERVDNFQVTYTPVASASGVGTGTMVGQRLMPRSVTAVGTSASLVRGAGRLAPTSDRTIYDTLRETSEQSLLTHTPETGGAWLIASSNPTSAKVGPNGFYSTGSAVYTYNETTMQADCAVEADMRYGSDFVGIWARWDTGTSTSAKGLRLSLTNSTNVQFTRFNGSTTVSQNFSTGSTTTTARYRMVLTGSTVNLFRDGTLFGSVVIPETDMATITGQNVGMQSNGDTGIISSFSAGGVNATLTGSGTATGVGAAQGRGSAVRTGKGTAVGVASSVMRGAYPLPAGDPRFLFDSFSDDASRPLEDHIPEAGGWVRMSGNARISTEGKAQNTSVTSSVSYFSASLPPSDNYEVSADLSSSTGIYFRAADMDNYYRLYRTTSNLSLLKRVGGSNATLLTVSIGSEIARYTVQVVGSTITILRGSSVLGTVDDNTFSTGRIGITLGSGGTNSIDNLSATAPVPRGSAAGTSDAMGVGAYFRSTKATAAGKVTAVAAGVRLITREGTGTATGTSAATGNVVKVLTGYGTSDSSANALAVSVPFVTLETTATAAGTSGGQAKGSRVMRGTARASGTSTASAVGVLNPASEMRADHRPAVVIGVGGSISTAVAESRGMAESAFTGNREAVSKADSIGIGYANAEGITIITGVGSTSGASTADAAFLIDGFAEASAEGTSTAIAYAPEIISGEGSAQGTSYAEMLQPGLLAAKGVAEGTSTATAQEIPTTRGRATATGVGTAQGIGRSFQTTTASAAGTSTTSWKGGSILTAVAHAEGRATYGLYSLSTGNAAGSSAAEGVGQAVADGLGEGKSTGTSTAEAVGSSIAAGEGTSNGQSTADADAEALYSFVEAVGTASGTSTAIGVGEIVGVSVGHAEGHSEAIGVSIDELILSGVGTVVATSTALGVGIGIATATGTADGSSLATGIAEAIASGVGTVVATSTAQGVGSGFATAIATAEGTSLATGIADAISEAIGTSIGTSAALAIGEAVMEGVGSAIGSSTADAISAVILEARFSVEGLSTAEAMGEAKNFVSATFHAEGKSNAWGTAIVVPTERILNTTVKAQPLHWADEDQGAVRVDDWPNPSRDLKTIMIHTDDFEGVVTIQASLHGNPGDDDWFDVRVEVFTKAGPFDDKSRNRFFNSRDRFIWMRAKVEKVKGRVDRIMVI